MKVLDSILNHQILFLSKIKNHYSHTILYIKHSHLQLILDLYEMMDINLSWNLNEYFSPLSYIMPRMKVNKIEIAFLIPSFYIYNNL